MGFDGNHWQTSSVPRTTWFVSGTADKPHQMNCSSTITRGHAVFSFVVDDSNMWAYIGLHTPAALFLADGSEMGESQGDMAALSDDQYSEALAGTVPL